MNPTHHNENINTPPDGQFDRLVDGELSPKEYRRLLQDLESQPNGWRRCAEAFLEAQAWRQELGALSARPHAVDPPSLVAPPSQDIGRQPLASKPITSAPRPALPLGGVLAVAASFVIAFALGAAVVRMLPRATPTIPAPELVETSSPSDSDPTPASPAIGDPGAEALVVQPERSHYNAVASPDWSGMQVQTTPVSMTGVQPRGDLTLQIDDDRQVQLPVYNLHDVDQQWLAQPPRGIGAEEQHLLEQAGHRVVRHRRLAPIALPDGSYVLVPVEELEISPAANRFQ